ncbi:MAG TPA: histidine kinase, partial [Sphingomicrobium sp.]|nr:histidine kinase [Sphingomicrobium sp.]
MSALSGPVLAIVALALLWLAVGVLLAMTAARRLRLVESILGAARSNAALLEISPARPLVVHPDGSIECDPLLLRDLGVQREPKGLPDLAGEGSGIAADDLQSLISDVEAARTSGGRVERKVRVNGSARIFDVRGGPAPAPGAPGTMLLWFLDMSSGEEERAKLALRLRQTEAALNSLTHLIEAAPFPMWYRGSDLKLGLVNSAFVRAVEGKDAAEVIERSAELIDAEGEASPLA